MTDAALGLGLPTTARPGAVAQARALRAALRRRPWAASLYRALVAVVGGATVLLGLVLVPLPGPGWVVVGLGVAVLGSEFAWAARVSGRVRAVLREADRRLTGRPVLRLWATGVSVLLLVLPLWVLR